MPIVDDTAWMTDALCTQIGPDIFHPEGNDGIEAAQAACALCPVRRQCLNYATEHDIRYGVWGGVPHQFRAHRRSREDREYRAAGGVYAKQAHCGYCGNVVPLRKDGSFSIHNFRQDGREWRCQFSRRLPPWNART